MVMVAPQGQGTRGGRRGKTCAYPVTVFAEEAMQSIPARLCRRFSHVAAVAVQYAEHDYAFVLPLKHEVVVLVLFRPAYVGIAPYLPAEVLLFRVFCHNYRGMRVYGEKGRTAVSVYSGEGGGQNMRKGECSTCILLCKFHPVH